MRTLIQKIVFLSVLTSPVYAELPVDKAAHFGVSLAIQTGCEAVLKSHTRRWVRHVACGAFTASVGIAKEVWDKKSGQGNPEVADLAADAFGIGFGILVMHW